MTSLPAQWLEKEKDRRILRVEGSAVSDRIYEVLTAACAFVVPALVVAIALAIFVAVLVAYVVPGLFADRQREGRRS